MTALRPLALLCRLLCLLLLAACATPAPVQKRNVVVLLPRDGKPSGEVVVTTAHGTQVLKESYQSADLSASAALPVAAPLHFDHDSLHASYGPVLSALPPAPEHFVIYFRLDSTELIPQSRLLLPEIVQSIGRHRPAALILVGHTDSVGREAYNYHLGQLRADAVLALLRALGAQPQNAETSSRGKREPRVKNGGAGWEPGNRRVEISVQ